MAIVHEAELNLTFRDGSGDFKECHTTGFDTNVGCFLIIIAFYLRRPQKRIALSRLFLPAKVVEQNFHWRVIRKALLSIICEIAVCKVRSSVACNLATGIFDLSERVYDLVLVITDRNSDWIDCREPSDGPRQIKVARIPYFSAM